MLWSGVCALFVSLPEVGILSTQLDGYSWCSAPSLYTLHCVITEVVYANLTVLRISL